MPKELPTTNITEEVKEQFNALMSGRFTNFALMSCFCDGEPTSVIVLVIDRDGGYDVRPLFVAVTPGMKLTDHEGTEPNGIRFEEGNHNGQKPS